MTFIKSFNNVTQYFLQFILLFAFFCDPISQAILDIALPDILENQNLNSTLTVAEQISVLIAIPKLPTILLGIPIGLLVSNVDSTLTICLAFLLQGMSNLTVILWANFYSLIGSAFLKGSGMVLGAVSTYHTISNSQKDDSKRGRILIIGSVMTVFGYIFGYLLATLVYANFGRQPTFAIPCLLELFIALSILPFHCRISENDEITPLCPTKHNAEGEKQPEKHQRFSEIFLFVTITVVILQTFLVYVCTAASRTIAPYMLQKTIGLSLKHNGTAFAVAGTVNVVILSLLLLLTKNQVARYLVMSIAILIESAATAFYPHVFDVTTAIVSETFVAAPKTVVMALGPAILMQLIDSNRVGTYATASSALLMARTCGGMMANVGSGYLVEMFGFFSYYYGITAVLLAAFSFSFCMISECASFNKRT